MSMIWGVILIVVTGFCWLVQVINTVSPALAAKLGLNEPESDVDLAFFADTRGEAIWDALILWTLPAAGILLVMNNPWWAYLGLVGGGMYLYFAGRGLVVRTIMRRRGIRIGKPETVMLFNAVLTLWGLIAIVTLIIAVGALPSQ